MNIKRIFVDMDGTLLNSQGRVSKSNADLIRQAQIPVTLVSARAPMEMREAIEALDLSDVQVGFNGGLIYRWQNGCVQPLQAEVIQQQTTAEILHQVRKHFPFVGLSYYDLNNWYCDKIDEGIRYEYELTKCQPTFITDGTIFLKGGINIFKIMMITFEEETMQILEKFLQSLSIEAVSIQRSGKFYLEITHAHAKKSKGINYIFKKEKLSKTTTAAFGDGHNDIPMLEIVGYPIVMENAMADIKTIAYQVTKSNDDDGVGYGIHQFLK